MCCVAGGDGKSSVVVGATLNGYPNNELSVSDSRAVDGGAASTGNARMFANVDDRLWPEGCCWSGHIGSGWPASAYATRDVKMQFLSRNI